MKNQFEQNKKEDMINRGSGQRSLNTNREAIDNVLREIEDLKLRQQGGEDVIPEIQRLLEAKKRFEQDQGRIAEAGI